MKGLSLLSKRTVNKRQYNPQSLLHLQYTLTTNVDALDMGVSSLRIASWRRQENLKCKPIRNPEVNIASSSVICDLIIESGFKSIDRCRFKYKYAQMTTKRDFHHSLTVGKRLKLSPLPKVNADDKLRPTTIGVNDNDLAAPRSRILFHTEDLAEFVEKTLEVMGVVGGEIRNVSIAIAKNGEIGIQNFLKLCKQRDKTTENVDVHMNEHIDSRFMGEGKNDIDSTGGKENDRILLQRDTVESLLQYASDFDIAFPRGTIAYSFSYLYRFIV